MANNGNNGNMFDPYDFGPIFAQIAQNFGDNGGSLANNEFTQELFQKLDGLFENVNELNKKDINKAFDLVLAMLRSIYGNSSELTNAMKMAKDEVKAMSSKQSISDKLIANIITGAVDRIVHASMQAAQHGEKGALNVANPKDKASADRLAQIFQTQLQKTVNGAMDKLLGFLGTDRQQQKTRMKQFGEDLIEGLAKSKFVGGALTDLIRLATFFAASWLKNFGPLGKALAVGLVALGPIIGTAIASALVKSLPGFFVNIFKTGFLGLGNLLKASFMKESLLKASLQGRAGASAIAGVTRGGLAVGSGLALAGAGILGKVALDTWKEGGGRNKTAGVALGVGAAGLGALGISGLIAALVPAIGAGLMAAVAPIAVPVVAIATGIGLVVKFWPQIMDFFKSILGFLGLLTKDKDDNYVTGKKTVKESLTGYGGKSNITRLKGKSDKEWNEANTAALKVSETGLLMNTGELTQENLSKQVAEYTGNSIRSEGYKKLAQNYDFIRADDPHVSASDFKTDAITEIDGVKYIIAPKGTYSRLLETDKKAAEKGIKSITQLTGAIGTAGNYASREASPHKGTEHFKPIDAAVDVVTRDQSGKIITDVLNTNGVISSVWGKKAYIHDAGSGKHAHMEKYASAEGRENWEIYQKSLKEQKGSKIESNKKSIAISEEEKGKGKDKEKEQEKPKSLAEQNPNNPLFNSPITRAAQHFAQVDDGSFIDFSGNKTTQSAVMKTPMLLSLWAPNNGF